MESPSSTEDDSDLYSEKSEDTSQSSDSSSDEPEHRETARKRMKGEVSDKYLQGKSNKAYRLRESLSTSLTESTGLDGICSSCAPMLERIAKGFKELKHHGTTLRKRKRRLPQPKFSDRSYYRNVIAQNEWIRGNLFDSMGNYLCCHQCIVKALSLSSQRLPRQRKISANLLLKLQRDLLWKKRSAVLS